MADEGQLSQQELDELLGALGEKPGGAAAGDEAAPAGAASRGPGKAGKVKLYDFRRPDRFSKDHIRTLEMVHDSFARFLQASLSTYLRSVVEAKVSSVQQMTYEEFISSLSNPTSINIFTMEPLKGNAVFDVNAELMFAMIDRVLGGPGIVPKKIRELTAIEIPVAERIVVRALDNLREAWQKVAPIVPKLEQLESNPHFVQIAAPSEIVALIAMDIKVRDQAGRMHLCLPYVLLEPIVPRLLAREWIASGQKGGPTSESLLNLKRGLGDTNLRVTVILGRTRLTVDELMGLKAGDVIRLDRNVREDLVLEVEGREKYRIRPCIVNRKKGGVVAQIIVPPEDMF
ncbi:MAG: flagellar motor switch protein FliM [Candidatus Coatesbacteria bacterium]